METISILGLYNYDSTVFDNLQLPEALNKDVVVDNILLETAELETIYTDSDFMKNAIGRWSAKEKPIWEKLYQTTVFQYNPIWNKDANITETETINRSGTDEDVKSGQHSDNYSDTSTDTTNSSRVGTNKETTSESGTAHNEDNGTNSNTTSGTDTLTVAGFNSNEFVNRERHTTNGSETGTASNESDSTTSSSGTREDEKVENISDESEKSTSGTTSGNVSEVNTGSHDEDTTRSYERNEHGNIGITSTQQLIKEEREIDLYNIYDVIIESFKRRFCLLVY